MFVIWCKHGMTYTYIDIFRGTNKNFENIFTMQSVKSCLTFSSLTSFLRIYHFNKKHTANVKNKRDRFTAVAICIWSASHVNVKCYIDARFWIELRLLKCLQQIIVLKLLISEALACQMIACCYEHRNQRNEI